MTTTSSVHGLIRSALADGGLAVHDGPAMELPVDADGFIAQAAVLWPAAGQYQYRRMMGQQSGREDRLLILCVGATTRDALAVADKVENAIGGLVLPGKGGTLRQVPLSAIPAPEPNADPVRVSLPVEYTTITKG
jgi:hypothetical protein